MANELEHLRAGIWALSTLRVAAESDLLVALLRGPQDRPALASATGVPQVILARVVDVLTAYGFTTENGTVALTDAGRSLAARGDGLLAELDAVFGQARGFVEEARRGDLGLGWRHVDPAVIRAQGTLSERMMSGALVPMKAAVRELELLATPGAKFLDVGAGAAGGSIALCRHFPSLRVVGLEPLPAARREARTAIAASGLADRIELRADRIETLRETGVYSGAFLASQFFDDATLTAALAAVHRALVPGGVVLFSAWNEPDDGRIAVVGRLRAHLWGGGTRPPAMVLDLARAAGFTKVLAAPPMGDIAPLVAIR